MFLSVLVLLRFIGCVFIGIGLFDVLLVVVFGFGCGFIGLLRLDIVVM